MKEVKDAAKRIIDAIRNNKGAEDSDVEIVHKHCLSCKYGDKWKGCSAQVDWDLIRMNFRCICIIER
jgi:hypothetical protein